MGRGHVRQARRRLPRAPHLALLREQFHVAERDRPSGQLLRGDASPARGQPRDAPGPAPAHPQGDLAVSGARAGRRGAAARRARRVRPDGATDGGPATRLRAEPAPVAVRARRDRAARHRLPHLRAGRGVRDRVDARRSAADPHGPAARRPRRGRAADEGRRHRIRGADGAPRGDHLAEAARGPARAGLRDVPHGAPVGLGVPPVPQVGRAGHGRAHHDVRRTGRPLRAGPLGGAGAALPRGRLPGPAPDGSRRGPHRGTRRPHRVAGRADPPGRFEPARRVGVADQSRHRIRRSAGGLRCGRAQTDLGEPTGVQGDGAQRDVQAGGTGVATTLGRTRRPR